MTIRWIGGAALLSATVAGAWLATAGAASGDRTFIRQSDEVAFNTLPLPQRVALRDCILAVDPDAQPASFLFLKCEKGDDGRARCYVRDERTVTSARALAMEDAGRLGRVLSHSAGNVTYEHESKRVPLTASQWACFADWVGALAQKSSELVHALEARKSGDGTRYVRGMWHDVLAPDAYWAAREAGEVYRPTGVVE